MNERSPARKRKQGNPIDWPAVRRRLEEADKRLADGYAPDGEEKRRILAQRARELASRDLSPQAAAESLHVVEFLLADERYGFELRYVREIIPLRQITPLPCTPGFVLGVVNVRGQILSVIDIKKFFELPEKGLTDLNRLIVLEDGVMVLGVLADGILQERSLQPGKIQPSLPTLTGVRQEYLKGVGPDRLVVLDAGKILSDERLIVQEEVV